jgi:hypothetical protein
LKRPGIARRHAAVAFAVSAFAVAGATTAATPSFGDPAKVIRAVFVVAETGFDPQAASDLYSTC